jgi:DNA-binding GntR family transcriptional regulator
VIGSIGERTRLADAAYARLRQAIFTGQVPPGTRLSIPAIAARFGVSRSPVREAVLRLVHDGLAAGEPHKGVAVIVLNARQLVPVYEVRAPLEGLAARLAAASGHTASSGHAAPDGHAAPGGRPPDGGLTRLTRAVAGHAAAVDAGDLPAARDADVLFHRITREMAGNPQLISFLDQIQDKILLAMASTLLTAGPALALADHRAICEAIVAGDPDLAEARASAHVTRLRDALAASPQRPGAAAGYGDETATDW